MECALFGPLSQARVVHRLRVSFYPSSPLPRAVRLFLDLSRSHLTSATSAAARPNLARLSRARELAFALTEGINSRPPLVHIISAVPVFPSPLRPAFVPVHRLRDPRAATFAPFSFFTCQATTSYIVFIYRSVPFFQICREVVNLSQAKSFSVVICSFEYSI